MKSLVFKNHSLDKVGLQVFALMNLLLQLVLRAWDLGEQNKESRLGLETNDNLF